MAIIQSILVGKGKGKVGNVVLTTLKGQTVAKALNSSPANPKTPLQVASRIRMSNAVMAWKFLAGFFIYWMGVAKSKESVYNAFVSASKNYFSNVIAVSLSAAAAQLGSSNLAGVASAIISGIGIAGADLHVSIKTSGLTKPDDLRVRAIMFDSVLGVSAISDRAVTLAEWNAEELTVVGTVTNTTNAGVYLYSSTERKASNAMFAEV